MIGGRLTGRTILARLFMGALCLVWPAAAMARDVDIKLLLAVDVSRSVDATEYHLQMGGLADAFRHADVLHAIEIAPSGIAVALMQWSGPGEQVLSLAWTVVRDRAAAFRFAEEIETISRLPTGGGTALADALDRAIAFISGSAIASKRTVIDISGDGGDNRGASPVAARTIAVLSGITVNGLAIVNEEPYLVGYYRENVVGGPGAFVLQARDYRDFARAIRLKLVREIAGSPVALLASDHRH